MRLSNIYGYANNRSAKTDRETRQKHATEPDKGNSAVPTFVTQVGTEVGTQGNGQNGNENNMEGKS